MTLKIIRRVMLYSLVAVVLFSCTFQPHQTDSSFREDNKIEIANFDESEIMSKNDIGAIMAIPHDYSQIGNWSGTDQVHEVVVDENYAYVAAGKDGVRILDISDKTNVTQVSYFQDGTTASARGIFQNETYLFVAYGTNLSLTGDRWYLCNWDHNADNAGNSGTITVFGFYLERQ